MKVDRVLVLLLLRFFKACTRLVDQLHNSADIVNINMQSNFCFRFAENGKAVVWVILLYQVQTTTERKRGYLGSFVCIDCDVPFEHDLLSYYLYLLACNLNI